MMIAIVTLPNSGMDNTLSTFYISTVVGSVSKM